MIQKDIAMSEQLDKNSRVPLPEQLKTILRRRIEAGYYKPGERIDTVRKLATAFKVSTLTVQRACKLLEEERCIISMPQSGMFVPENFFERPQNPMRVVFVFPEVEISPQVLDLENWAMTNELNRGLLAGAQESDLKIDFLHIPTGGNIRERFQRAEMIRANYDSAIFFGTQLMDIQLELASGNFPVYSVCADPDKNNSSLKFVFYDQERAIELVVESALKSGAQKFAVFSSTQDFYYDIGNYQAEDLKNFQSRPSLFLALCKKRGIEQSQIQYCIFDENNRNTIPQRLKESHGAFIFCNNAYLVRDIYVAAYENSMIPGKDFQIMAIASGITFTGLIPSLSYVRVPLYEVGLQLIRMAHRKFRNPGADIQWEPVQPEIVLNETSKLKNKNKECI